MGYTDFGKPEKALCPNCKMYVQEGHFHFCTVTTYRKRHKFPSRVRKVK